MTNLAKTLGRLATVLMCSTAVPCGVAQGAAVPRMSGLPEQRVAPTASVAALEAGDQSGLAEPAATDGSTDAGLAAAPCPNATTSVSSLTQLQAEAAVFCLTNRERVTLGLSPLRRNSSLAAAARQHARAAVALKWWLEGANSHVNPWTGSTPSSRMRDEGYCLGAGSWSVRENTYWGNRNGPGAAAPTAAQAVKWWMSSLRGHRANILGDVRELGVGVVLGAPRPLDPPVRAATFVQDFGKCGAA
jgi:uncharacterized protein YkwD